MGLTDYYDLRQWAQYLYVYKCPCGAGTYLVGHPSDDWGRNFERWEMDCPKCSQNYDLWSYWVSHKRETWQVRLWVPKESYERLKRLEGELERCRQEITEHPRTQYMDQWLGFFADARSKKEVWQRLREGWRGSASLCPSLSTFYRHVRYKGRAEEYLADQLHYFNVPAILRMLDLYDPGLQELFAQARELEEALRATEDNLKRGGYGASEPLERLK